MRRPPLRAQSGCQEWRQQAGGQQAHEPGRNAAFNAVRQHAGSGGDRHARQARCDEDRAQAGPTRESLVQALHRHQESEKSEHDYE
ncbi:hypothetical protein [Massilia sp. CCM 8734]|uniref:hypothetical protein n=1 Tax=Massilia sp. CCM 8734 TaxID=2609283 RepID=UPI0014203868|nr:hypothetical protein [Massilia sp. CCM 8734]NIA00347.1 hypothetical protein [Massilia sp. CCM 8734]